MSSEYEAILANVKQGLRNAGCWSPKARTERFIPHGRDEGPAYLEVGYVHGEIRVRMFEDRLTKGHVDFHRPEHVKEDERWAVLNAFIFKHAIYHEPDSIRDVWPSDIDAARDNR